MGICFSYLDAGEAVNVDSDGILLIINGIFHIPVSSSFKSLGFLGPVYLIN